MLHALGHVPLLGRLVGAANTGWAWPLAVLIGAGWWLSRNPRARAEATTGE